MFVSQLQLNILHNMSHPKPQVGSTSLAAGIGRNITKFILKPQMSLNKKRQGMVEETVNIINLILGMKNCEED